MYQDLVPFYDRIFPLNQPALNFIMEVVNKGESLLDIGAGTGNLAIALAEKGYKVTASEPEERMAKAIREKAIAKNVEVNVYTKTMEEVDEFTDQFHAIVCVGNTLPHLPNIPSIKQFFQKCHSTLKEGGKLIIQTVNYDKVLGTTEFSFPVINTNDFIFERHYEKKGEHILFTTKLTTNTGVIENTIPLFPITAEQLISLLHEANFHTIELYGNFKKEKHTVESPATIVIATK